MLICTSYECISDDLSLTRGFKELGVIFYGPAAGAGGHITGPHIYRGGGGTCNNWAKLLERDVCEIHTRDTTRLWAPKVVGSDPPWQDLLLQRYCHPSETFGGTELGLNDEHRRIAEFRHSELR